MEGPNYHEIGTKLLQQNMSRLDELVNSTDGWSFVSNKNDVMGYMKKTESGINIIKGIGQIHAPLNVVKAFLDDFDKKKLWDKMLIQNRVIAEYQDGSKVINESFKAPWPVSNRDFVYFCKDFQMPDGIATLAVSVESNIPVPRGHVRGEIDLSVIYYKEIESGVLLTYLVNVDPKGSLPAFAVNYTSKSQISNVHQIRKLITGQFSDFKKI